MSSPNRHSDSHQDSSQNNHQGSPQNNHQGSPQNSHWEVPQSEYQSQHAHGSFSQRSASQPIDITIRPIRKDPGGRPLPPTPRAVNPPITPIQPRYPSPRQSYSSSSYPPMANGYEAFEREWRSPDEDGMFAMDDYLSPGPSRGPGNGYEMPASGSGYRSGASPSYGPAMGESSAGGSFAGTGAGNRNDEESRRREDNSADVNEDVFDVKSPRRGHGNGKNIKRRYPSTW